LDTIFEHLKEDSFITKCAYSTIGRNKITMGGYGIHYGNENTFWRFYSIRCPVSIYLQFHLQAQQSLSLYDFFCLGIDADCGCTQSYDCVRSFKSI